MNTNQNSQNLPEPTAAELARYEKRAPGWRIRCKKCGYTQPYGKYGIRKWAAGRKCILAWCSRCHRLCCHFIEKQKSAKQKVTKNPYRDELKE